MVDEFRSGGSRGRERRDAQAGAEEQASRCAAHAPKVGPPRPRRARIDERRSRGDSRAAEITAAPEWASGHFYVMFERITFSRT